jgi:hypothetical protein
MSSSVVIAAWPIRLPKSWLGVFFQDPHRNIPGRQSNTFTSVWEKTKNIVRTQIPPPTRFSSTLTGLEQAWVSYSLRFNTDFTLTSLRSYFEVTSVSRRSRFDSTAISLRFHFGLIANSLQSHFGLTSVSL